MTGVSAPADRATHEPNPQAVSAVPGGIPDAADDGDVAWDARSHPNSSNVLVGIWKARANMRHHLMTGLTYRETSKDPKGNGFSFAEVPDWQLRQWIDAVESASQVIEAQKAGEGQ